MIGQTLGSYHVLAKVGVGGMGEVYRARDTRLGRDVAIKVPASELAADPDRQRRLEREARAIAALSHPNICALHDIGHHGGVAYLVMEFLDGQTLAARLESPRGTGLPLSETLHIGSEIAAALDAAHRQGIVHRDLSRRT
jgi:serine/threonine protein kinase